MYRTCKVCKKEKPITDFYKSSGWYGRQCKSCIKEKRANNPELKYTLYRLEAGYRKLKFNLTKQEFFQLWNISCYYCGSEILSIGIDRLDNSKGYEINNIIPCCSKCNIFKLDYSKEEFFSHVDKIYHRQHSSIWEDI